MTGVIKFAPMDVHMDTDKVGTAVGQVMYSVAV